MQKILIAIPLALASMVSAQNQQPPAPGVPPVEVPQPDPQPAPPAPDGVPPVEAPPIAPPPPGQTPPVAAPPVDAPPGGRPPVSAPPMDSPVTGMPPAPAQPPASSMPEGNPPAGTTGDRVVTYVNNNLPPAPAAQQDYPPCSATVRDQCQQREGRQVSPRRRAPHSRH